MAYEVEIRFWMNDISYVWKKLPFLKGLEWKTEIWYTEMFGIQLFKAGELLRISKIKYVTQDRLFLGWKGVDKGKLANIRNELGEEITKGITNSAILPIIGIQDTVHKTSQSVINALNQSGFSPFMSFSGKNLVASDPVKKYRYKIMQCADIRYNPLIEVEKIAESLEESYKYENELQQFTRKNNLEQYRILEEPPTLLYLQGGSRFTL